MEFDIIVEEANEQLRKTLRRRRTTKYPGLALFDRAGSSTRSSSIIRGGSHLNLKPRNYIAQGSTIRNF